MKRVIFPVTGLAIAFMAAVLWITSILAFRARGVKKGAPNPGAASGEGSKVGD